MKTLLIASVVTGLTAAAGTVLINAPRIVAHVNNTNTPVVSTPKVTQIEEVQQIKRHRFDYNGSRYEMEVSQMSCYTEEDYDFFFISDNGATYDIYWTNHKCKINWARDIDTNEVIINDEYVTCKSIYRSDNSIRTDNTNNYTTCKVAKELGFIF